MTQFSIHIVHLAANDWVVREHGGRELGRYPSQQEAENVGRPLARKRKAVLLIDGRHDAHDDREPTGWLARLFGR
jgi:Uncharacterized protein conserved in bacteria (DUF2188)